MKIEKENWFGTPIYYYDNLDVKSYEKIIEELPYDNITHSNRGGKHSNYLQNNKNFKPIIDIIENKAIPIWNDFHPNKKGMFKVNNIWSIINEKGDYNVSHFHPGSIISGCVYIKANEKSGNIIFQDPRIHHRSYELLFTDNNSYNTWEDVSYEPKTGRIIFFPSYIEHEVKPNISDEKRIIIAFNMVSKFD